MQRKQVAEGVVARSELYTLERVKSLLGLTQSAMRSLRHAGLPVIRFGKRAFVSGAQLIDFFERLPNGTNTCKGHLPK